MDDTKIYWTIVILVLVTTFLDVITALTSPIYHIVESNPLYVISKSSLFMLSLISLPTFYYLYKFKKEISLTRLFLLMLFFVYVIVGHLVGIATNIIAYKNFVSRYNYVDLTTVANDARPLIINKNEIALKEFQQDYESHYTSKDKIVEYSILIGSIAIIPFILSYASFIMAMSFYNSRKPLREKTIDDIYNLSKKLQ